MENGPTGTFGNVQMYLRRGGRDVTNRPSYVHPEIAAATDRSPTDHGCAATMATAPQLLITNVTVASAMLSAFTAWRGNELQYEEVYLDISSGRAVPVRRRVHGRRASGSG